MLHGLTGMFHSYVGGLAFVPLVLWRQSMLVMECYLTTTYHNLKRWLIVMLVPYMLKTLYFLIVGLSCVSYLILGFGLKSRSSSIVISQMSYYMGELGTCGPVHS